MTVGTFIASESIDKDSLRVKRENIVRGLGVPDNQTDEYLLALIDNQIENCLQICKPVASANIYDYPVVSKSEANLKLGSFTFNLNKIVANALDKSTSVALFAVTCGRETGLHSARLISEGHALEGLIVDLIGSEIAEEVAELVHARIGTGMALRGLNVTNRYSPGYCNWPVSDQQKLFHLLDGNTCGITLTESSLMIPIKSVSGIIGIGHEVKFMGYNCRYCEMDHCLYRNRK